MAILISWLAQAATGQDELFESASRLKIVRLPAVAPAGTPGKTPIIAIDGVSASPQPAESLDFAWNTAFASDPISGVFHERVAAAEHSIAAAQAERMPSLQVIGGAVLSDNDRAIRTQNQTGNPLLIPYQPQDQAAAGLMGNIPIYQGGKIRSLIEAADGRRQAELAATDAYCQELRLSVAREFLQVLRGSAELAAASAHGKVALETVRDAQSKWESGQIDLADLMRYQASLAEANYRIRLAEIGLAQARMVYNNRLGRDPEYPCHLALPRIPEDSFDPRLVTELALQRRPELSQALAEAQALESESESRRASARPQVNAGGGLVSDTNPFQAPNDMAVGYLTMTWQLYDAGRSSNQAQQLRHQAAAKRLEYTKLCDDIRIRVWQACSQLEAARARLAAEQATLQAQTEQVRRGEELYDQVQITRSQLLELRQALTEAELRVRLTKLEILEAVMRIKREAHLLDGSSPGT